MATVTGDQMPTGLNFPTTWKLTGPLPAGTVYTDNIGGWKGTFSYTVNQTTGYVENLEGTITGISGEYPHYMQADGEPPEVEWYSGFEISGLNIDVSDLPSGLSAAAFLEFILSGDDTLTRVDSYWDSIPSFKLSGYGGNDKLYGSDRSDILDGGTGADTMIGGGGHDLFIVDNELDVVEGNAYDTVQSSVSYTLTENLWRLILTGTANLNGNGNAEDNIMRGNRGNNVLDGKGGVDQMTGGTGNDSYYVNRTGDTAVELANEGIDQVFSTVNFTLGVNVENLSLIGTDNINATGNNLENKLLGNAGNNVLDGRAGADIMSGDTGNDTYIVDNAGDKVVETAGDGSDTINASISYSLAGIHVERLELTGTSALDGTGNSLDNTVVGNLGNNILNGAGGKDKLYGAGGADTLIGGSGADQFVFTDISHSTVAKAGQDTIVDFSKAQGDRINLSAIDANALFLLNQEFTFIGTAAYSKTAGELRYGISNGQTTISGDIDGNGQADFRIFLNGSIALQTSDFIL